MYKSVSVLALALCAFANINGFPEDAKQKCDVYLYGETHGVQIIIDKEFEIWDSCYQKGMRDLFVELPYYTAEYLNVWLREDTDCILNAVYSDWDGTASHNPYTLAFFRQIKEKCPQTVFHGTDVGHQYNTTGKRFLGYLEKNNLTQSKRYALTKEAIAQGIDYYSGQNAIYRENTMVSNFIREISQLHGAEVMGIYGSAHTKLDALDNSGKVPCMAAQLKAKYGNAIHSEDLSALEKAIDPIRVDAFRIDDQEYVAYYYGKQDLTGIKDYAYREFWRLDGAYDRLKDSVKTGDVLPYGNYPMNIELRQVYVIDYTKKDETKIRMYYKSDGAIWNGVPVTENIDFSSRSK